MRLFRSPIILPLLVLVVFTATCVLAVPAGDNGSSSSSSSSTKGRLAKLLGRFKKNKPPSLLDHLNAYMPAHEYAELKPTWDRAVEQGWIRPDTGEAIRYDGIRSRQENETINLILHKIDPYIEELARNLPH